MAQRAVVAKRERVGDLRQVPEARALNDLVEARLSELRATVRRNLPLVTLAVLGVLRSVRSGYGRLSLSALARALPTPGDQKTRFKRISRFLANKHFCPEVMIPALVGLVVGGGLGTLVPVMVDVTYVGRIPTLMAGVLHEGRVLPIGFSCFDYARLRRSQNALETNFLRLIIASLGKRRAVFTADRAYGRHQLIEALNGLGQLFVLRCRSKVVLWQDGLKRFPRQFRAPLGEPKRFCNLRYHKCGKQPVDLIVYHERRFAEVWYLLVPAASEAVLPTEQVVKFYRCRMQIEQGFRDWKTHLGVRGLRLKANPPARLGRLLLAFALAYICLLLLGSSKWAQRQRRRFETPRRKPRHGTTRTISVLSLGMLLMAAWDLLDRVRKELIAIIRRLKEGAPAYLALRLPIPIAALS